MNARMKTISNLSREELIAALHAYERQYSAIADHAPIGIFHRDADGRWRDANVRAAHMLGYARVSELLAAQPDQAGNLFKDSDVRDAWLDSVQALGSHTCVASLRTKNGQGVWISLDGHRLDDKGSIACAMYDVTEHHNAEVALIRAKEQADFANRSKSEFLANMSHELRTPLNAIIGFSEIIKDQLFGAVGQPQYVEYAKDIYDSGQLLLSLINDILDMSKIEAGKRALQETDLNLDSIACSVLRLVAARAKEGKVRVSLHIPRDLPFLRGEEKAMKQILTNLLNNAVKFTPEGGSVTLSALIDDVGCMVISVIDSGIGIAPHDIAIALAPFGQIESALSRKYQGSGLGLPLTKALVELHGGAFDLESEPNVGTTVMLVFPAKRVVPRT